MYCHTGTTQVPSRMIKRLGNFWKISHAKVPFPAFSIEWVFKIYDYVLQILFYLDLHILCWLASFPCKYFFGSGKPMHVFFFWHYPCACIFFLKKNTPLQPNLMDHPLWLVIFVALYMIIRLHLIKHNWPFSIFHFFLPWCSLIISAVSGECLFSFFLFISKSNDIST